MSEKYILEGKTPIRCDDVIKWSKWFEKSERQVAKDEIDGVKISTVFLGLDYGFGGSSPVLVLFETMVFGGALDQEQARYCTWDEAETGHKEMVERVKASLTNKRRKLKGK